jgi:alpha-ketoglutarate-dependent taurine dioxygenase
MALAELKSLTWSVSTPSFNQTKLAKLPLIVPHFATGRPALRYHEPWPEHKTRFHPTDVSIDQLDEKASSALCDLIDELLHDRRVCYWHAWEEGDFLVSDNVAMMHTRSSFDGRTDRCLRRIHVD